MKEARTPNPHGGEGKPISLYPLKPAEAMRGLLAVKPQPKATKKPAKKTSPKK